MQLRRLWSQNYAFVCVCVCAMQLTTHVHLVVIWDMNSWMYSFSQYQLHKSFAIKKKKDLKPETTSRSYVSSLFNIAPGLRICIRSLLRADWNLSLPANPKRIVDAHPPEEDAGRTHVRRKVWERNLFSATRSNKYFSSGTKPAIRTSFERLSTGLEIISASSLKRHRIFLSEETFPSFTVLWQICMRLYVSTLERVRTHGWTAKLPPEVGVGIHLIDDVTLREWSRGGCWSVDVNPKFSNVLYEICIRYALIRF